MPIPGFSEEESIEITQARRDGILTPEQEQRIIDRFKESVQPQTTLFSAAQREQFEASGRPLAEAVGGTAGAIAVTGVSATRGPAALAKGTFVGGPLGAATGTLAFDNLQNFLEFSGVFPKKDRSIEEVVTTAQDAAIRDALFGGGAITGIGVLRSFKPLIGKMLGVRTEAVDDLVKLSEETGVNIGAVDVAPGVRGRALKITSRILGIFPFIGGPFRKEATGKAAQVIKQTNKILDTFAPSAILADELGIDMFRAAQGSAKEFRSTAARLYNNFHRISKDAGPIVPTRFIRKAAEIIVTKQEAD